MPQYFQVLKCFKCSVFQVHQTKKSNKWECKLCGEKQSIKRHYGLGTAKECRLHVQKLNGIRGEIDEASECAQLNKSSDEEPEVPINIKKPVKNKSKVSKWSIFVDKTIEEAPKQSSDESMFLENVEVVLDIPVKKRKKFNPPKLPEAKLEVKTMLLDYEPIEPVCTQTESLEPDKSYSNSFFKFKSKPQIKSAEPVAPLFGQAKNNIQINKPKVLNQSNNICNLKQENHKTNKTTSYIPPNVNKSSKWAEYTEESDENLNEYDSINEENLLQQNIEIPTSCALPIENMTNNQDLSQSVMFSQQNLSQNITQSQQKLTQNASTNKLFDMCDESELDDVLDL